MAGGDESAAASSAQDGARAESVKDDADQTLDNTQMSWVYSLVTQALANLVVDINGLTIRAEMLRCVRADAPAASAKLEQLRPRQAERRRRCRLTLNGQEVNATAAGFGPTVELVSAAQTVNGLAVAANPPLADGPLRNAAALRGQIAVVERGSVSFVEKARRLQAAGAAAVIVLNVDEADYVPLGMVGDSGSDIAVPVVCVRRSSAELLKHLADLGQSCRVSLMLDGMATHEKQNHSHEAPVGGVGGTPAQRRPAVSVLSPVTVQAVVLDHTQQMIPDDITTVTADTLAHDIDCSSATSIAVSASDDPPAMPPGSPASSFAPIHFSDARSDVSLGTSEDTEKIDAKNSPAAQYVVEPAWALVLVFDVVRSHSTDATWRDVQIDAATGDPVDSQSNSGGSVPERTSGADESTDASVAADTDASATTRSPVTHAGVNSHGGSALHRVVDFGNLVMYVCEKSVLDGLDFTLRIKLKTDTSKNLRHIDVTIPKVSLGLSQVQARVLRYWYDWFMSIAAPVSTTEAESFKSQLHTPKKAQSAGVAATPANNGANTGAADVNQESRGWLGWAWGMVAGPEGTEHSSGVASDAKPSGSPPSAQSDTQRGKPLEGATGEDQLIETVKSNYKASAAAFLMYVVELDIVLRLEDTRYLQQYHLSTGSVQARNAAYTNCGGQQQDGCFARFRFRELLVDQSKSEGQPVDVVVSSNFADVYALATTMSSADGAGGSTSMENDGTRSYAVPGVDNMDARGVPVVICGQNFEHNKAESVQFGAKVAGVSGGSEAPPATSAYGSLNDSTWDEAEQDSLNGIEPPRPVPPSMPPRSRHRSAVLCVKVRGADPAVPESSAQVETQVIQAAYFNASEFNEDISLFCSEMLLADEHEGAVPKEAERSGKPGDTDAPPSNTRRSSTAHADLGGGGANQSSAESDDSVVSSLTGEQLVEAAVELARRMRSSGSAGGARDCSAHRQEAGANRNAMPIHAVDDVLASTALGQAATGMLTEVERRALDWTTSELAEVKEERDKLKAELQEVRARLRNLESPGT